MAKNKLSGKTNISSTQVIKTLKVLMQGDYSMKDLVKNLNKEETEPVFNNSVISKYINTCRFCGIEIPKINNKYYLAKLPFGLDLTLMDVDNLKYIQTYVKSEMTTKQTNLINSLVKKISRFSNKDISRIEKDSIAFPIEIFERAKAKKQKVKLIFKNKSSLECIPLSIIISNDKKYFNVFDKRIRNIDSERLSGIELSGQRYIDPFGGDQIVVFKLKSPLAQRYEARENEHIQQNPDGTITVTNKNENKKILFSRLLRYDDKCELIRPKGYREDMKELINDMLNNYGI